MAALLASFMPVTPVHAAAEISITPEEGEIGERIIIVGNEFNRSTETSDKYAAVYFSSQEATIVDDIGSDVIVYEKVKEWVWLDEDGDFETSFKVPQRLDDGKVKEDVRSGIYYIYICHYQTNEPPNIAPRIRAVAEFKVVIGEISLSETQGPVGSQVTVTGSKFPASSDIRIAYDSLVLRIESGDRKTNANGNFVSTVRLPDSNAGLHTILATVSSSTAVADFLLESRIVIYPTSGAPSTAVTIDGTGFNSNGLIEIEFNGSKLVTGAANAAGTFKARIYVPELESGTYQITASDGYNIAQSHFSMTSPTPMVPQPPAPAPTPVPSPVQVPTNTNISSSSGPVGKGLLLIGVSFKPNSLILIRYDDELMTAVSTDSSGIFSAVFEVPPSKSGTHPITITDGVNISERTFTVESTPPLAPTLILPEIEEEVSPPLYFVWSDVSDESEPVHYVFQISNTDEFSASTVILEKRGLTTSELTLTAAEIQKLTRGSSPYYWRVRAVDAASNEGRWTYPGTFNIYAPFPAWATIILAILAALSIFGLGYLARTRSLFLRKQQLSEEVGK